jgi:hypothetical protein
MSIIVHAECRNFYCELHYAECRSKEALLKCKSEYGGPPCTNLFISAAFYIESIIYLSYKTSFKLQGGQLY